jgi:hypothetical protein
MPFNPSQSESPSLQFIENLKITKGDAIKWNKERRRREDRELQDIESKIQSWGEKEGQGPFSNQQK